MTLNEVANSLYNISVCGYFNGEKFSRKRFVTYIKKMFSATDADFYIEVALPDGWWLTKIYKVSCGEKMYDYYLPDTRKEEKLLWDSL